MTTPSRALASLLRPGWLLAATLAIIAGLLGMHVLASGHASHGAAAPMNQEATRATAAGPEAGHPAGHTAVVHANVAAGHGHAAEHGLTAPDAYAPYLASATCSDTCPGVHESGAPCIPSAPVNPLTLFPPEGGPALPAADAGGSEPSGGYTYSPPSPTPCELSISRT